MTAVCPCSRRALLTTAVAALALIALAAGALWRGRRREPSAEGLLEFMRASEKVQATVLTSYDDDHRLPRVAFELSDPDEVRSVTALLALEPKRACRCDHLVGMVFQKGESSLHVEVCDHCLDVWTPGGGRRHHAMPGPLWDRFRELLGEHMGDLDESDRALVSELLSPGRAPDGVRPGR